MQRIVKSVITQKTYFHSNSIWPQLLLGSLFSKKKKKGVNNFIYRKQSRNIPVFSLAGTEVKRRKSLRFIDKEYSELIQTALAGREYL